MKKAKELLENRIEHYKKEAEKLSKIRQEYANEVLIDVKNYYASILGNLTKTINETKDDSSIKIRLFEFNCGEYEFDMGYDTEKIGELGLDSDKYYDILKEASNYMEHRLTHSTGVDYREFFDDTTGGYFLIISKKGFYWEYFCN